MPTQLFFTMLMSCSVATGRCASLMFLERVIMLQTI
ncbi:hypothetical protein LINPERHAP1_LOCUS17828 [Linum perenne]